MADGTQAGVRVLTVTISDSRKRYADDAGKRLDQELTNAGLTVVRHVVLSDDADFIRELVRSTATDNEADAIVLTGGTGITPRDHTYEALEGIFEKRIEGFGEAFRRIAFDQLGPRAMFFRATAGTFNQVPIFSLPGNAQAVVLGVRQLIAPTLVHAVEMAMGRQTHTIGPAPSSPNLASSPSLPTPPTSKPDMSF